MSLIQTSTLTQQVVDLLKQRILDGELLSGQRVWAADLAQEFGVSSQTVDVSRSKAMKKLGTKSVADLVLLVAERDRLCAVVTES